MPEDPESAASFGANAWLVDEMYDQYRRDPSSVSESWREFFADYRPFGVVREGGNGQGAPDELGGGATRAPPAAPAAPPAAPAAPPTPPPAPPAAAGPPPPGAAAP